ncbi:MAG: bifunctional folylpolyglutamate synthase/dihydrofolate synthase [Bryobacteraceae bacterium]|nr:bifunctional folylpolyglutamate synthase/dihydrofolate synthase [Bryobacteraceae bacterium]
MQYPETVQFLYALGNETKTVKLGLEAIGILLDELGNPHHSFRSIHVAGTNGKGSTCALMAAGLRNAGLRTGLYTSPHLIEPSERIQLNGMPVTREQFAAAFATVDEANEGLLRSGRLEYHTTYFETVTAMGFLLFAQAALDMAVVEVGLGGRLDATNAITPELSVITPIDFDHEQYLGNRIESIASEKAGILKPGIPAVFAAQRPEAQAVLDQRAAELACKTVHTCQFELTEIDLSARGSRFTIHRTNPIEILCPLAGAHQVQNAVAAAAALELLQIQPDFSGTHWPGRLQLVHERPDILLDGAHNPAGARALAAHIQRFYADRKIRLIYGAMRDKSVDEITEILFPLATEVIVTAPSSPRAIDPYAVVAASDHPQIRAVGSVAQIYADSLQASPDTLVVITGSLYLVGEILTLIQ